MSKKNKSFSAFGVDYRTIQFSAVEGMLLMNNDFDFHPTEILRLTEVRQEGVWLRLNDGAAINACVRDKLDIIAPRVVLNGIISLVHEFNFGFLDNWKSTKVPLRFVEESRSISSKNVDPMTIQLIQDGVATLKELEEYYSLEDAFKLFDSIMIKGINQAIANEAAMKKNKR